MMAPAAQNAAASSKAGAFEVSRLFVADKAARDEAQKEFAAATKDVEFLGQVGYADAAIKVSSWGFSVDFRFSPSRHPSPALGGFQC